MSIVPYVPQFSPTIPLVTEILRENGITPQTHRERMGVDAKNTPWEDALRMGSAEICAALDNTLGSLAKSIRSEQPIRPYLVGHRGAFLPEFTRAFLGQLNPERDPSISEHCLRALYAQLREVVVTKGIRSKTWQMKPDNHDSLVLVVL